MIIKRFVNIVFLIFCMILAQGAVAHAAPSGSLQVELKSESTGAAFGDFTVRVWLIADGELAPTAGFIDAQIDWNMDLSLSADNSQMATNLAKYIETNSIPALYEEVSDVGGKALFTGLEGIYFVAALDNRNPARYRFTDFIVPIPFNGRDTVVAAPKGEAPAKPEGQERQEKPKPPPPVPPEPPAPLHPEPPAPLHPEPPTPPPPHIPGGQTLVPGDDGKLIQHDEDGVPLGEWTYDDDLGEWVFNKYPPLADFPQTSALYWPVPVLAFTGMLAIAFGLKLMRKEE